MFNLMKFLSQEWQLASAAVIGRAATIEQRRSQRRSAVAAPANYVLIQHALSTTRLLIYCTPQGHKVRRWCQPSL